LSAEGSPLVSPGCRRSKVRVARLYLGKADAHWPTPKLDLAAERRGYEAVFATMREDFADIEFTVDELVTDKTQIGGLEERLRSADGVLLIHLSMGMKDAIEAVLACGRPTALFAAPYSGHEWSQFGALRQQPAGAHPVFPDQRPHPARAAVGPSAPSTTCAGEDSERDRAATGRGAAWKARFGTEVTTVNLERMLAAYERVPLDAAEADAGSKAPRRWSSRPRMRSFAPAGWPWPLRGCSMKRRPRSSPSTATARCTASCRRSRAWRFVRLNDLGLGGICESDSPAR
jgi:hypothetical protein